MFDFIKKHLGYIVLIIVIIAILAPMIFTLPGFKCLNFLGTGQIGDTIGGTTAPFWGFLSVILLYLTFKEQQDFNREQLNFNKTQQSASDYDILIKMRDNISALSANLEIDIVHQNPPSREIFKGAPYIENLRGSVYSDNYIEEKSFDKLYKDVIEIVEMCLLYYKLIESTSLNNELKDAFYRSTMIHSESICRLLFLYQQKNINVILGINSIGIDIFKRYEGANNRLLHGLLEAHKLKKK